MVRKFRDISIINIGDTTLSAACDSSAGIGALDKDIVKSDGHTVGYYSAFVPLVETIAIGAKPMLILNTLSVPGDKYGQSIIDGVKQAASEAGLNEDCITGSTEENFAIEFTSVGITVIGDFTGKELPTDIAEPMDLYLIGLPKVGYEVVQDKHLILTMSSVSTLKSNSQIVDILPVGSKGILSELNEMANALYGEYRLNDLINIDLNKSAGPATCAIVAVKKEQGSIFSKIDIPVNKLGEIIPKKL